MIVVSIAVIVPIMLNPTDHDVLTNSIEVLTFSWVENSIPTIINIILGVVAIFGGGLAAALIIIGIVNGWDYAMNYKIPI